MKKMIVLWLLLLVWGGALVSAQVRIGGSGDPNAAAVLDLNADNAATPAGNKGALALPRINLSSVSATLNGAAPLNGMLVYHTGSTLSGEGVYVWTGSQWTKVNAGSLTITNGMIAANAIDSTKIINGTVGLEDIRDGIISNAKLMNGTITGAKITNATITGANMAATTIDSTKLVNATVGVTKLKDGAVTNAKIALNTIGLDKIYTTSTDSSKILISNGTSAMWALPISIKDTTDRTLSLLSTTPTVTWTKIVDSSVNVKFAAAYYQVISVPDLLDTDFCRLTHQTGKIMIETINGGVRVYSGDRKVINVTTRLLCYRPSL